MTVGSCEPYGYRIVYRLPRADLDGMPHVPTPSSATGPEEHHSSWRRLAVIAACAVALCALTTATIVAAEPIAAFWAR